MAYYVFKRLLMFPLTMFGVFGFVFLLSKYAPGDPVERLMEVSGMESERELNFSQYKKEYADVSKQLYMDSPNFYFSLLPNYYPVDFHQKVSFQSRPLARNILHQTQDFSALSQYLSLLDSLEFAQLDVKKEVDFSLFQKYLKYKNQLQNIDNVSHLGVVIGHFKNDFNESDRLAHLIASYESNYQQLLKASQDKAMVFPSFYFNGLDNQFHHWIANGLSLNFGVSQNTGRPVNQALIKAMTWTAAMVFLALIISTLLGVGMAVGVLVRGSQFLETLVSNGLFVMYAIPVFWLATLLISFFTTAEYGEWTHIFPSVGISYTSGLSDSTWTQIIQNGKQLILPTICISLHSLAYLYRQFLEALRDEVDQPYFLTARAKGMTKGQSLIHHGLKNAMIPFITIFSGAIPAALAGSVIVEIIFNIPGMGRLMYDAISYQDSPVLLAGIMMIGIITMVSYLIGDLLYVYIEPRISLDNKKP